MMNSKTIYDLYTGDAAQYQRFVQQQFTNYVATIIAKVPFYRQYLAEHGLQVSDFNSLEDLRHFPVVQRQFYQEQEIENLIHSDIALDSLPSPTFTSGTSGAPLRLYCSRELYISAFYLMQRSYGGALPFAVVGVSVNDGELPLADDCKVYFVSRQKSNAEMFARLQQIKPQIVMIRPELWRLLCDDFGQELATLNLTVAGVAGVSTTAAERAYFGSILNCKVADMYGASELGGAIFECPQGKQHVIAHQNYLEILDDADQPVPLGERGHLVWTSLDNTIMPFVRYSIGDSGRFARSQHCTCGWNGPIVEDVLPEKKDELIFPDGVEIRFYLIEVEFHQHQGAKLLRQHQFIQESPQLLILKAVKSKEFVESEMQALLASIRVILRDIIQLQVMYLDHIPHTGNKFRTFIPLRQS